MNIKAQGVDEYYITYIDYYSGYGYMYLMHRKGETFDKFKGFRIDVEKQLSLPIKSIWSDQGGEYFLDKIESQLIAPETLQVHGVVERRRTLSNMVQPIVSYSTLHIYFCGYV